jgi:hypothetical protein
MISDDWRRTVCWLDWPSLWRGFARTRFLILVLYCRGSPALMTHALWYLYSHLLLLLRFIFSLGNQKWENAQKRLELRESMEPDMVLRFESWCARLKFRNIRRIVVLSAERPVWSDLVLVFGTASRASRSLPEVPTLSRLPVPLRFDRLSIVLEELHRKMRKLSEMWDERSCYLEIYCEAAFCLLPIIPHSSSTTPVNSYSFSFLYRAS